jgi:hypothetical protein
MPPPESLRLLSGPLLAGGLPWPWNLDVHLEDLRPRFLPKGAVGQGYRSIARNGRILLCSDRPVQDLAGRLARLRLQTWHRATLPGDVPAPFGILLCVRCHDRPPTHSVRLVRATDPAGELALDVGGLMALEFRPFVEDPSPR